MKIKTRRCISERLPGVVKRLGVHVLVESRQAHEVPQRGAVGARQDRTARRAVGALAQAPALLEPGDVADLPQRRIYDREPGAEQPLAVQAGGDAQRARAAVEE